ncbi:hypothetical protein MTO96_036603, partial [Rhipicephalus appendiculatus]
TPGYSVAPPSWNFLFVAEYCFVVALHGLYINECERSIQARLPLLLILCSWLPQAKGAHLTRSIQAQRLVLLILCSWLPQAKGAHLTRSIQAQCPVLLILCSWLPQAKGAHLTRSIQARLPLLLIVCSWLPQTKGAHLTSRHIGTAFSYSKPEEYDKAVSFMLFFMNLFRDIKIADGSWKPVQTGVLLSTTSILSLQKDLLKEGYKFVLTARFTQDSLENLFSMIRARNPIPTPHQCKMALRVISVSQYLKHAKKGNYGIDDGAFFLADYRSKFPESVAKVIEGAVEDEVDDVLPEMSSTEESAFVYMSGYLASSVLKNNTTCNLCKESLVDSQNGAKCVKFIRSKAYKDGCLAIPSQSLVSLLQMCESIFVKHASSIHKQINNAKRLQDIMMSATSGIYFPQCHNIKAHIIQRFTVFRIRIHLKDLSKIEREKQKAALEARKFPSASTARKAAQERPSCCVLQA